MAGLSTRVARALDWCEAALALAGDAPQELDLAALEAPAEKIVAEVAIFLREVAACPDAALRARALSLARQVEPLARNPRVAVALALRPGVARDVAVGHVLLVSMGFPDPVYADCLARSVASPVAGARERLPHRVLEQDWLAALAEGRDLDSAIVHQTALATGIDLIGANRDDLYALTHAIAYATDFGRWNLPQGLSPDRVLGLANCALANVVDDDDFDLVAELVLAWPCLGVPLSAQAAFALSVLERVEDEAGVVPSFGLQSAVIHRQPEALRKTYTTAVSYHTALVMGLACTAVLRHRPGVEKQQTPASGHTVFAKGLLNRLTTQNARPQWLVDAARLDSPALAALSPFLLDVALVRSVRKMDFGAAHGLLSDAVQAGVLLSPLALQTAQMLSRLAASTDALGLSGQSHA